MRSSSDEHLVLRVLEHDGEREAGVLQPLERAVHQGLVEVNHQGKLGTRTGFERQSGVTGPRIRDEYIANFLTCYWSVMWARGFISFMANIIYKLAFLFLLRLNGK